MLPPHEAYLLKQSKTIINPFTRPRVCFHLEEFSTRKKTRRNRIYVSILERKKSEFRSKNPNSHVTIKESEKVGTMKTSKSEL